MALLVGITAGLILGTIRVVAGGIVPPVILLAVGAGLALAFVVAVRRRRVAARAPGAADEELRWRGLIGRATVISARPTGRAEAGRREVDLRLEVQLPRRRRFGTEVRSWVPDSAMDGLRPGLAIAVAADPDEPGHIVPAFDVDELVSIAGLGPFAGGRGGSKPLEGVDPDRPGPDDGR